MLLLPCTAAVISAFQTCGPGTPSAVMPLLSSNAMIAPLVISPNVPGAHMFRSAAGVFG